MDAITIQVVRQESLPDLQQISEDEDLIRSVGLDTRDVLLVRLNGVPAGYGILNWAPKYSVYARLGVAEIQDLNVLPDYRRRGAGSAMIAHCEKAVRVAGHTQIGISAGVGSVYGAAQILYARLGYMPDGNGVTVDRIPATIGDRVCVDEDLCLMLVKELG